MAQAQITASDWSGALATTRRLDKMRNPDQKNTTAEGAIQRLSFLAQIALNPSEGLQVQLLQSIENRPFAFMTYRRLADALLRAKRYETVLEVIARAEQKYPQNHGLDPIKKEGTDVLNALAAAKPKGILFEERVEFIEDEFFAKLDTLMSEQDWEGAGEWARKMQQARPSWMKARETDILLKQIAIAHETSAVLEMTLAARLLLDGSLQRSQLLVDYALELAGRGEKDDALRVMNEFSRKSPNHALSRRYIKEWTEE
jgi:tetratricopeptide (TPR) repeat protein